LMVCVAAQGYLRIQPGEFQTDGFFAALIVRKS